MKRSSSLLSPYPTLSARSDRILSKSTSSPEVAMATTCLDRGSLAGESRHSNQQAPVV